jgi:hypothetical protein
MVLTKKGTTKSRLNINLISDIKGGLDLLNLYHRNALKDLETYSSTH